ncbi:30S ribosomal protein S20 [Allobacillus sp. GCM10007491]|uniref:Small ribosomal subunit protein bS20 n=1 Tax=Allobacillus saliphilus TaxID=2912308 RepID=A0A941HT33_9BACI|nr:30S ribosomal protein S20 [Allobacillus saliphilus]MBR7553345.1 30S ribosomal protein S20 [Allobacillus saliphilus]
MANTKSSTKRIRVNNEKRTGNQTIKSDMRSSMREVENHVRNNNADEAKESLVTAVKKIDKAQQRGIIHKNNASRKKRTLMKKVNEITS